MNENILHNIIIIITARSTSERVNWFPRMFIGMQQILKYLSLIYLVKSSLLRNSHIGGYKLHLIIPNDILYNIYIYTYIGKYQ